MVKPSLLYVFNFKMSDMEVCDESTVNKRCYKVNDNLFQSLNIAYDESNLSNSLCILWNKYQIYLYENHDFESPAKIFVPDFQIRHLINCSNYIICVDCAGNIHTTSLKFKNSAQKRFKSSFQPRAQGVLTCTLCNPNSVLSLRYENNSYSLIYHQVNSELQVEKKIALNFNKECWPLPGIEDSSGLLYSHVLTKDNFHSIQNIFNVKETFTNAYNLILVCFDKMTVHACMTHPKMVEDEITLIKLYTSPSEICDMKIIEKNNLNVVIVLTMGTVIKLDLENMTKTPEVIHLNTAISKVITSKSNDTLLYSDGQTMWKADNIFSKQDIKFSQLFLRHVKDFIKCGDKIVCTTFTNVIYTFPLEDESSYVKNVSTEEYCSLETLLNNSEYYYRIMKEIEKGNKIKDKIKEEGSYLTALALSRRQDIMAKAIETDVSAYDNYTDVIKEHSDVVLTEETKNYFEPDSIHILINVTATYIHHTFNEILSNLFGDIKVHINISTEEKTIKTTSIRLTKALKKVKILIPLKLDDNYKVKVEIKLVTNIPGSLNKKQDIWTVLYKKQVTLNSEHFIKISESNINISLKEPEGRIDDLIQKAANLHSGHLLDVTSGTQSNSDKTEWPFYVKLPINYKEKLKDEKLYEKHFNAKRTSYFLKHFGSDEFLKSKAKLKFEIAMEIVKIEIVNDFSNPLLKVTSHNAKIAFNMRNFFSDLVNNEFEGFGPGNEYVNYNLYTTTENIKKAIRDSIVGVSEENIVPLSEQFQKNVIGGLPL